MISKASAPHNVWGRDCHGWTLTNNSNLHVIQERMPEKAAEVRHLHPRVRQFYYVLEGRATVRFDDRDELLRAGEGVEVPPDTPHQIRNDSIEPLEFLVVSSAPPREDRVNLEQA